MSENSFLKDIHFHDISEEDVLKQPYMKDLLLEIHQYKNDLPKDIGLRIDFLYTPKVSNKDYDSMITFTILNQRAKIHRAVFNILLNLYEAFPLFIRFLDKRKKCKNESEFKTNLKSLFLNNFNNTISDLAEKQPIIHDTPKKEEIETWDFEVDDGRTLKVAIRIPAKEIHIEKPVKLGREEQKGQPFIRQTYKTKG